MHIYVYALIYIYIYTYIYYLQGRGKRMGGDPLGENAATRWSLNGMTAPSVCDVLDQNYRQGCVLEDGQPCSCC